jgi:molybdate transport system regulatory protein
LEAIDQTSSLTASSRMTGMPYTLALRQLHKHWHSFREPLVVVKRAGAGQGGVWITPYGRYVISFFRSLEREVCAALTKYVIAFENMLSPDMPQANSWLKGWERMGAGLFDQTRIPSRPVNTSLSHPPDPVPLTGWNRQLSDASGLYLRFTLTPPHSYGIDRQRAHFLEVVEQGCGLEMAAVTIDESYGRARGLVNWLNRSFREPLVERKRGGGGGTFLSALGRDVLTRFRAAEHDAHLALQKYVLEFEALFDKSLCK